MRFESSLLKTEEIIKIILPPVDRSEAICYIKCIKCVGTVKKEVNYDSA